MVFDIDEAYIKQSEKGRGSVVEPSRFVASVFSLSICLVC